MFENFLKLNRLNLFKKYESVFILAKKDITENEKCHHLYFVFGLIPFCHYTKVDIGKNEKKFYFQKKLLFSFIMQNKGDFLKTKLLCC